jgi:hypothetical protein
MTVQEDAAKENVEEGQGKVESQPETPKEEPVINPEAR